MHHRAMWSVTGGVTVRSTPWIGFDEALFLLAVSDKLPNVTHRTQTAKETRKNSLIWRTLGLVSLPSFAPNL